MAGALPIVTGVVSGVSAIGGISARRKQAKAEAASLMEQKAAREEQTRLRLQELDFQQTLREKNRLLEQIQATLAYDQQKQQLASNNLQDLQQLQTNLFENAQQYQQAATGSVKTKASGDQAIGQSAEQANQVMSQALGASTEGFQQQTGTNMQAGQALDEKAMQAAAMEGLFAAMGVSPQNSQGSMGMLDASANEAAKTLQQLTSANNNTSGMDAIQTGYAADMAELIAKSGLVNANTLDATADNQMEYARAMAEGNRNNAKIQRDLNYTGMQGARTGVDLGRLAEIEGDRSTNEYAQKLYENQKELIKKTGASDARLLDIQKGSISKPGLFSMLGAGLQGYNTYQSMRPMPTAVPMPGARPVSSFLTQQPIPQAGGIMNNNAYRAMLQDSLKASDGSSPQVYNPQF